MSEPAIASIWSLVSLLQRVLHPVCAMRRLPADGAQLLAVVEQQQSLAVVYRARVAGRIAEDRRIGPRRALDAVVVAVVAVVDHDEPVSPVRSWKKLGISRLRRAQ